MKWAYVVIEWATDRLALHTSLFTEEEAQYEPKDHETGLPNVVIEDDGKRLLLDDGSLCTWGDLCDGDTDVCLRLLEVIRNEATSRDFDRIPRDATIDIEEVHV